MLFLHLSSTSCFGFGHLLLHTLFESLLNTHLLHVFGADLHLFVDSVIVSFHDILDRNCARDNVSEAAHPHVSVFGCLSTQNKHSLPGLKVEAMLPVVRKLVLNVFFGQITVKNISEPNHLDLTFILFDSVRLDIEVGLLKIDHEVALRINSSLEEFDLLDELAQVALHLILLELAATCVGSMPRPELLVSTLNDLLILGDFLKLVLQLGGHVHG